MVGQIGSGENFSHPHDEPSLVIIKEESIFECKCIMHLHVRNRPKSILVETNVEESNDCL